PGAPREARATTVGTPLSPMDEIRILEPGSATELPGGQVGELCCRGPYTVRGYFDAAAHNARAFTPDGFYRTGDLASVREIGGQRYVSIEGRIKDVINRGGEKVNAAEVELLLLRHPRITGLAQEGRRAGAPVRPDRREAGRCHHRAPGTGRERDIRAGDSAVRRTRLRRDEPAGHRRRARHHPSRALLLRQEQGRAAGQ